MKRVLFFTLIHFAALGAKAHAACGFVPAFIHESIRDHADDPAIKQSAELALQHLNLVHGQRTQGLGGNGILIDDDDKNLPNEETPAGEQEIADETKALSNADKAATNSTSVETPNRRRQAGQVNKFVYNNDRICTAAPPKTLVRKPGSPVATDENVNNIWDQLAVIYDFYKTQFGRNSFDGKGGALHGTVHFCSSYNNALWDGIQMLFGDGDGTYFNSFTGLIDVTAHEVTHGVIQYSSDLDYEGESGALNEHLADVFGILVKQYQLKQTAAQSNWLIGEGLIKGARALRDMVSLVLSLLPIKSSGWDKLSSPDPTYFDHNLNCSRKEMLIPNSRQDPEPHTTSLVRIP